MYKYMNIYIQFCSKNDVKLVFIKSTFKKNFRYFFQTIVNNKILEIYS